VLQPESSFHAVFVETVKFSVNEQLLFCCKLFAKQIKTDNPHRARVRTEATSLECGKKYTSKIYLQFSGISRRNFTNAFNFRRRTRTEHTYRSLQLALMRENGTPNWRRKKSMFGFYFQINVAILHSPELGCGLALTANSWASWRKTANRSCRSWRAASSGLAIAVLTRCNTRFWGNAS